MWLNFREHGAGRAVKIRLQIVYGEMIVSPQVEFGLSFESHVVFEWDDIVGLCIKSNPALEFWVALGKLKTGKVEHMTGTSLRKHL